VSEFFSMSGYGVYLWPAFALGFGVVIVNLVMALNSLNQAKQEAKRRLAMNAERAS
jgi:heme exporter protein CcmD